MNNVEIATVPTRFGSGFLAIQIWEDGAMLAWWFCWRGLSWLEWQIAMSIAVQSYMATARGLEEAAWEGL